MKSGTKKPSATNKSAELDKMLANAEKGKTRVKNVVSKSKDLSKKYKSSKLDKMLSKSEEGANVAKTESIVNKTSNPAINKGTKSATESNKNAKKVSEWMKSGTKKPSATNKSVVSKNSNSAINKGTKSATESNKNAKKVSEWMKSGTKKPSATNKSAELDKMLANAEKGATNTKNTISKTKGAKGSAAAKSRSAARNKVNERISSSIKTNNPVAAKMAKTNKMNDLAKKGSQKIGRGYKNIKASKPKPGQQLKLNFRKGGKIYKK
jgi:hypothetical protein